MLQPEHRGPRRGCALHEVLQRAHAGHRGYVLLPAPSFRLMSSKLGVLLLKGIRTISGLYSCALPSRAVVAGVAHAMLRSFSAVQQLCACGFFWLLPDSVRIPEDVKRMAALCKGGLQRPAQLQDVGPSMHFRDRLGKPTRQHPGLAV